jgi:hypothetical protein
MCTATIVAVSSSDGSPFQSAERLRCHRVPTGGGAAHAGSEGPSIGSTLRCWTTGVPYANLAETAAV